MQAINLLPWREHRLRLRLAQKALWLAGIVVFCLLLSMLAGAVFERQVRERQVQAALLEQQTRALERRARHAAQIRETALQLEERLAWMQASLEQRTHSILILPKLSETLAPSLHLELLSLQDGELLLEGRSGSQGDISELLRGIRSSTNLGRPVLDVLEAGAETSLQAMTSGAGHRFRIRTRIDP